MRKLISYLLPVYNEEKNIDEFYSALTEQISQIEHRFDFELLYINDGSKDTSLEKLNSIVKKDKRVKVINFSRNFGHQAAITAGLELANGDCVIIMDTDLQDPPEVSIQLINKWEEGYEVVYAQRRKRKDGIFKKLSASMFYRIMNHLSDIPIPLDTGDFRLIDRKAVNELKKFREQNRYLRGLVSFVGFNQIAVEFDRNERYAGKTHYSLSKMIKLSLDGITGFSTTPLKLISQLGLTVSIISFIGAIYALYMRFFHPQETVSGWTALILAILFIGGVQIIMLGILGSYIGRIYSEVQKRPIYIVSSILSNNTND